MVTTTIILSAQFVILVWSDFVPTRNFGLLTTVGLISALIFDLLLLPALLITFYGPDSPVAVWVRRLPHRSTSGAEDTDAASQQAAVDASYWTAERKLALVREILSGKTTVAVAAREYGLPEAVVEHWHSAAEAAVADALGEDGRVADPDQGKDQLQKLARAYKKLKAENRELRRQRGD